MTPATYEVDRHWIEGLKNPTVVQDHTAIQVFAVPPRGVKEAIQQALATNAHASQETPHS